MDAGLSPEQQRTEAVVAIPACNEADWITRCLGAISHQQGAPPFRIVVLVNNSTDLTAPLIRGLPPVSTAFVDVVEHRFGPEHRTAGHARGMAMEHAARVVAPGGILLCTDADGQVAPDWLAANMFHIRAGADAVAGRAVIDPVDAAAIPAVLHENDARECAYAASLDEIDSLLDPSADDPWPRHTEHSGASIAVTLDAYHRAGGIPPIAVGEDRAFFSALRRVDARIRHALDVQVTVSGRINGRAAGGMADTIRRRLVAPDLFLDDALEPAANRARRARLRRRTRCQFLSGVGARAQLAAELGCPMATLVEALGQHGFGAAWELLEAAASRLPRLPLPVAALPVETARAERILSRLRARDAGQTPRWLAPEFAGAVNQLSETSRMAG